MQSVSHSDASSFLHAGGAAGSPGQLVVPRSSHTTRSVVLHLLLLLRRGGGCFGVLVVDPQKSGQIGSRKRIFLVVAHSTIVLRLRALVLENVCCCRSVHGLRRGSPVELETCLEGKHTDDVLAINEMSLIFFLRRA